MSTPLNPLTPPQGPLLPGEITTPHEPSPAVSGRGENPPWTPWDVALLVVAFLAATVILGLVAEVLVGAAHLFGYSLEQLLKNREAIDKFSHDPRVVLPVQLLSYLFVLILMIRLVRERTGGQQGFFESVRWRWPHRTWPGFLFAGAVLAIVVQLVSARLPIPPSLPIEKYFQTATYAYLMAAFGILVAPFIEELFFRGFLYPVLAHHLRIAGGVILTGAAFMLVHGWQLGFSWAAMLMMLIVGVVLTLVRVRTKSLAPSVLMHAGYNLTLFGSFFYATDGFRHLTAVLTLALSIRALLCP